MSALAGLVTFGAGLIVLRINPFWRPDPILVGALDHRVYAWNGVSHLICAVGMLSTFGALINLASRPFSKKWLYWATVILAMAGLIASLGISKTYPLRWVWQGKAGVTEFTVFEKDTKPANWVWQSIVRWQIEPELKGWLGSGSRARTIKRSHGYLVIKVMRIVPIAAVTTLDCDCFGCCGEDAK